MFMFMTPRHIVGPSSPDYSVWYDPKRKSTLDTNLIIVEAKKAGSASACLGQLTAYMGAVHAFKKDEQKENSIVYGVASDGLEFRFCRINNQSNWSRSRLMEWEMGDKSKIYSVFRSLIRIAALSSPSTSPIKNVQQRGTILASFGSSASFGSPERSRKFYYDLNALEIVEEEDDETEIISWRESSS
ncbi:MAG: hypothetical protein Q9214_000454 [Letrouitia sp. 1 TL-2023]